jgi:hypothetical protein
MTFMKNLIVVVALAAAAVGPVAAQQTPSTNQRTLEELGAQSRERDRERLEHPEMYVAKLKAGVQEYLGCVDGAAASLDDRYSDAATVALGVRAFCAHHLEALAQMSVTDARAWGADLHGAVIQTLLARRVKLQKAKDGPRKSS